jgi:predicted MPP superfamily phosphohydrolase
MIDFIGDIHGHASTLELLLKKLGYESKSGSYKHPERKILFIGDYIDRGPQIRETLHLVRNMVENGSAIALMGNHEYNAIGFHTKDENGGHLRKHDIKNIIQHFDTIKQF